MKTYNTHTQKPSVTSSTNQQAMSDSHDATSNEMICAIWPQTLIIIRLPVEKHLWRHRKHYSDFLWGQSPRSSTPDPAENKNLFIRGSVTLILWLTFFLGSSYNSLHISSDLGWEQRFLARSEQTLPTCMGQREKRACRRAERTERAQPNPRYLLSPIYCTIGTTIFLAVSY